MFSHAPSYPLQITRIAAAAAALLCVFALPARAQACAAVSTAHLQHVRCVMQHALAQARLARDHARSLPGADPATVQLPERLVLHLELALDNDTAETDSIEELLGAHAAHRGHPALLVGGLQTLTDRLRTSSHIGALAVLRHGTTEQVTAWEWTTQALEAAQRLWRPLIECYMAARGGPALPATRVAPPCP